MEGDMLQDLRYGFRMLMKNRGFTLVIVLTLALGIGANSVLFSIVNGVLLNPLPYPNPDQLVTIHQSKPNFKTGAVPYPNFLDLQKENKTFSAMALSRPYGFTLFGEGEPERVDAQLVTADFFSLLGVQPLSGRTFVRGEDLRGAEPVVLISEGLWRRKLGSAQSAVGKAIALDDRSYTVIGIIPSSFHLRVTLFESADVYVPIGQWNRSALQNRGAALALHGIGRLKPGVTVAQGQADLDRIMRNLAAAYPNTNKDNGAAIIPLKERMTGRSRPILLMLLGAVGFVLLIACVNVSNLLMARSTTRAREFAIRSAMGAGRGLLLRQSLVESGLLAVFGGVLGLTVAAVGTKATLSLLPSALPRAEEVALDSRVLIFTIAISILTGILCGLAPALRMSQGRLAETLKEGERSTGTGRMRTQNIFVAIEMALALVLLIGAGLMIRTMAALWNVDPGFRADNVLAFGLNLPPSAENVSPASLRANLRDLNQRIAAVPGVKDVSFSIGSTPMGDTDDNVFWLEGQPEPANPSEMSSALIYRVEPGYLSAMKIPLKQGRFFTEQDDERTPRVVVIDEGFAKKYFPNQNPIGRRIQYEGSLRQIIGVVGHVKQFGLDADDSASIKAQLYDPFRQFNDEDILDVSGVDVFVRSEGSQAGLFNSIRQAVAAQNSRNVIFHPQTMNEVIAGSLAARRFTTLLLGVFSLVALLLTSLGIYGVISYFVGQRTHEFGIRIALGATRANILGLVISQGMRMALFGITVGLVAAVGLTRLMTSMLYGASATDPATFALIASMLTVVALLATFIPARRATSVEPLTALRWE